jgi:hypothetical protein
LAAIGLACGVINVLYINKNCNCFHGEAQVNSCNYLFGRYCFNRGSSRARSALTCSGLRS